MKVNGIAGEIAFGGHILYVYDSLNEPLFLAAEVANLLNDDKLSTRQLLDLLEDDEKMLRDIDTSDIMYKKDSKHKTSLKVQTTWFLTELGLYNALSQSQKPIARGWRRIVHEDLIFYRKRNNLNIEEQFDEWDERYSDLYFDWNGVIMQSVTIPGGDVIQIPYEMGED